MALSFVPASGKMMVIVYIAFITFSFVVTTSTYPSAQDASTQTESFIQWYNENRNNSLAVEITSPLQGQQIPITGRTNNSSLDIIGTSTDNSTTNCRVSVIANALWPYQPAMATGPSGADDYSTWNVTLDPTYYLRSFKEGEDNEIVAKLSCLGEPNNTNKWRSVNVTGVEDLTESMNNLSPLPASSVRAVDEASVTGTDVVSNKTLSILFSMATNPVELGAEQMLDVNITDAATGNSVENVMGEFKIVDEHGNVIGNPSYVIIENGTRSHDLSLDLESAQPGNYTVILHAYTPGYEPSSQNLRFEAVDNQLEVGEGGESGDE
jgi:hypothetical protein